MFIHTRDLVDSIVIPQYIVWQDYTSQWLTVVLPKCCSFNPNMFAMKTNISSSLVRFVEPSFPFLQFIPGLPHALCLLLHGVRRICRVQKGTSLSIISQRRCN